MMRKIRIAVLAMVCSGCVIGPDGRRILSPSARAFGEAMLEQVLTCSVQVAVSAAVDGGAPGKQQLLEASACHIKLAAEQIKGRPAPTIEHGGLILQARDLEDAGKHAEALEVARECDRKARGGR